MISYWDASVLGLVLSWITMMHIFCQVKARKYEQQNRATCRATCCSYYRTLSYIIHGVMTSHDTDLFMLTQDVSKIPMSLSTPSRISRMTSGGIRSERISDRDSGLMLPTASFASCISGSISDSSISMAFFLFSSLSDSSPCFCFNVSISLLDSLAR